jgi:hypothetical protein
MVVQLVVPRSTGTLSGASWFNAFKVLSLPLNRLHLQNRNTFHILPQRSGKEDHLTTSCNFPKENHRKQTLDTYISNSTTRENRKN